LFIEYEKLRVLTELAPMFLLSCATRDLPGWFHSDPTTGNGSSPQLFVSAFQLSCV
jgi:hypothetical protein